MSQKVTAGVYKGVTTAELDTLAAETAASMTTNHPDYATVSGKQPGPAAGVGDKRNGSYVATLESSRVAPHARLFSRRRVLAPCCELEELTSRRPAAARSPYCSLEPAQEHDEIVFRDVRSTAAVEMFEPFSVGCDLIYPPRCSTKVLYEYTNERNGQWSPLVSKQTYDIVMKVSGSSPTGPRLRGSSV